MSATDRRALDAMLEVTERLTGLLEDQAQAFEQRRPQDAAASLPEIARLAGAYQAGAEGLRAAPAMLKGAPPELRERLLRASHAFEVALERQGQALGACKVITEGVVKAIADEVARLRGVGQAYGPGGARKAAATAITLNRRA